MSLLIPDVGKVDLLNELLGGVQFIAPPATAPTVNPTGGGSMGGSLAAGTYYCEYTYVSPNGETTSSPESIQFTVSAGNQPSITFGSLPQGVLSVNIYLTLNGGLSGSENKYATGVTTSPYIASAANPGTGGGPPGSNTASWPQNWVLKLYSNNHTPAESDVAGTYTEATFTGYSAKTLIRDEGTNHWAAAALGAPTGAWAPGAQTQVAESTYAVQTWFPTSTQTVYGYYVVGFHTTTLEFAELFTVPKSLSNGDTLNLTPRFGVANAS